MTHSALFMADIKQSGLISDLYTITMMQVPFLKNVSHPGAGAGGGALEPLERFFLVDKAPPLILCNSTRTVFAVMYFAVVYFAVM